MSGFQKGALDAPLRPLMGLLEREKETPRGLMCIGKEEERSVKGLGNNSPGGGGGQGNRRGNISKRYEWSSVSVPIRRNVG